MSLLITCIPFITDRTTRRRLIERTARRFGASRNQAKRLARHF